MEYTGDLKSPAARIEGSSPSRPTKIPRLWRGGSSPLSGTTYRSDHVFGK
jgi:hypothetical protein